MREYVAEFVGTFLFVFFWSGAAIIWAAYPQVGVAYVGVSIVCGFTFVGLAFASNRLSLGHFNPAITMGFLAAGRVGIRRAMSYTLVQVAGAIAACSLLTLVANGKPGFSIAVDGFSSNGYSDHSPGGYSIISAFAIELITTLFITIISLSSSAKGSNRNHMPIAVGLGLVAANLLSIPITNGLGNPARSTGSAVLAGGWAMRQLWLFWVAPLAGAMASGLYWRMLGCDRSAIEMPIVETESARQRSTRSQRRQR